MNKKQKFKKGDRVFIGKLPECMSHFTSNREATVEYTYGQRYPPYWSKRPYKEYCLNVDGKGEVSWYPEECLTLVGTK